MLHERRFFFLASKAIVFTLSCVYGRSLFTGYLTNVIHPTLFTAALASLRTFAVVDAACATFMPPIPAVAALRTCHPALSPSRRLSVRVQR